MSLKQSVGSNLISGAGSALESDGCELRISWVSTARFSMFIMFPLTRQLAAR
jgi:hypothetical protein